MTARFSRPLRILAIMDESFEVGGFWSDWSYVDRFRPLGRMAWYLRRIEQVFLGDIDEFYDAREAGLLTPDEVDALVRIQFMGRGRRERREDAPYVYLTLDIARILDSEHVQRSARAAAALRKLGLDAEAFAAGLRVADEARSLGDTLGVTVILDTVTEPAR